MAKVSGDNAIQGGESAGTEEVRPKPAKAVRGRGWHGDPSGHSRAGQKGGRTTAARYGHEFYELIGRQGGNQSSGKFAKGDPRAKEAGRKGGEARQRAVRTPVVNEQ